MTPPRIDKTIVFMCISFAVCRAPLDTQAWNSTRWVDLTNSDQLSVNFSLPPFVSPPSWNRAAIVTARSTFLLLLVFPLTRVQREQLHDIRVPLFEIRHQSLVGEVERMRMLPVMMRHVVQTLYDVIVVHFDGQLAPVVKTAWADVDRAYDCPLPVGKEHLGVKLEML